VDQICVRLYPADTAALRILLLHCARVAEFSGPILPSTVIRWAIQQVAEGLIEQESGCRNGEGKN